MNSSKLPLNKQIAYASGMMGWSIMTNIIIVMLPYFYLPPSNSGLSPLIPQVLVFGVVNIMSLIVASGRFIDAVWDPMIAQLSDRSNNSRGRRTPFMAWAILPSVVFCSLCFFPFDRLESNDNAVWLTLMLVGFFISITTYAIPYNALLPELTGTSEEKVKLSSFQQAGFVLGMIISAFTNNFADLVQTFFHISERMQALQYTVTGLSTLAGLTMLIPVSTISEKKYSRGKPTHLPIWPAIRHAFSNRNFRFYLISDFSYYMALSIISSGLLFFVTVLLGLPESEGGKLMGAMVITSLVFYPFINRYAARKGKKPLILFSFGLLSLIFIAIYFLGRLPAPPMVQIYTLIIAASLPLAALGILPNAILAEIAEQDAEESGQNHEGMFFAVKYLFVKLGQTLGIALFAFLTIYGKDPGNDLGLRLNGLCGFILCLFALIAFNRFRERKKEQGAKIKNQL